MSKKAALRWLAVVVVGVGIVTPIIVQRVGAQQASIAQVLQFAPKCDDVAYSKPEPKEVAECKLEVIKLAGGGSGYSLSDGQGRPLRKFVDSDGDGKVDTWSYFQDGVESYREQIVGKGFSFRWMGPGGMKWGMGTIDAAGKARIESWKMISADEAAKEAFQALATGDFDRMKALMITPQEMQALGLPQAEMQRLMGLQKDAAAKFQKLRTDMPEMATAKFSRLENAKPGAYLADTTGGTQDIVKIPSGLILFENAQGAKKPHDWLSSFEIVQAGNAWRLTAIPGPDAVSGPGGNGGPPVELLNQLAKIDEQIQAAPRGKAGQLIAQRILIVEQIANKAAPAEKENWYKQIFDNLASAVVDGDDAMMPALTKWKEYYEKAMPGSNLAAYGAYRHIWAYYTPRLIKTPAAQLPKLQAEHHQAIVKFLESYPKADDAPDGLTTIATGAEFSGNEAEAKKWYGQIVANFPLSPNAAKAAGAIRRIDSLEKAFSLSGPTVKGNNYTFAPGKITVVYYWASYSTPAVDEFKTLSKIQQTYAKDVDIVTVNLDDKQTEAIAFLSKSPLVAQTLHQPGRNGGMDGPLAVQWGIFAMPHAFLIGADGKMINNKVQINALDDEISKLVKK
jgi:thiol-disulfide isomerase/thioredoxin